VAELRGGVLGRGASVGAIDLTFTEFQRLVSQGGRLVVNFSADWCPASRQFMPIFLRASQRHPDVVFGKVDTSVEKELSAVMEITSIPTVMAVYGGALVYRQAGLHQPDDLDQVLAGLRRVR
jgi:thioredoxin 1